jgi:L-ribulose-5-phosphate 3-epimerase UlaE
VSFADEVQAAGQTKRGPSCSFVSLELDEQDTADLKRLLDDVRVQSSAIARALQGRGYTIKAPTVSRHRRRGCDCP